MGAAAGEPVRAGLDLARRARRAPRRHPRGARGWLAIDPKPLVGERAFDCASLLRDRRPELLRDPDPRARVRRRLDQLAEELELDRERLRGWVIVHAVACGGGPGGDWYPDMVACAGWLADAP